MTDAPLLELRGVYKSFGSVQALTDVDFEVRAGEVMALVGDNGAGKSTLIKCVAGIHGYDPALPEMAGVLLAMGRGVPDGRRLPAVRAIDVAPTAAALLGIDPPRSSEGAAFLPIPDAPR